jgi:hypothetical protein
MPAGLGCLVVPAILGTLLLVRGLYLVFWAEGMTGGQTFGALLMTAAGFGLLLPVLAWFLFVMWLRRLKRNLRESMESLVRGAQYMATQGRQGGDPPSSRDTIEVTAEVVDEDSDKEKDRKQLESGE